MLHYIAFKISVLTPESWSFRTPEKSFMRTPGKSSLRTPRAPTQRHAPSALGVSKEDLLDVRKAELSGVSTDT